MPVPRLEWARDRVERAGRVPASTPRADRPGGRGVARRGGSAARRACTARRSRPSPGISADYYLRLEQGRDRNPSPQVLESLARVFGLDATATQHLLSLSNARATAPKRPRREVVPTGIRQLLAALQLPGFVENRMFDVLAANPLATALSPSIRPGENRLRSMFLDQDEQNLHPDWEHVTASMIASFRASIGADVEDPRIAHLVGELSASESFRRLWARHDVKALAGAQARIRHPQAGMLKLRREKLPIGDTGGQLLVIYHAEPGSESASSLARLSSLTAADQTAATVTAVTHGSRTSPPG